VRRPKAVSNHEATESPVGASSFETHRQIAWRDLPTFLRMRGKGRLVTQ